YISARLRSLFARLWTIRARLRSGARSIECGRHQHSDQSSVGCRYHVCVLPGLGACTIRSQSFVMRCARMSCLIAVHPFSRRSAETMSAAAIVNLASRHKLEEGPVASTHHDPGGLMNSRPTSSAASLGT